MVATPGKAVALEGIVIVGGAASTTPEPLAMDTVEVGTGMRVAPGQPLQEGQHDYSGLSHTGGFLSRSTYRNNFQEVEKPLEEDATEHLHHGRSPSCGQLSVMPRRTASMETTAGVWHLRWGWHVTGFPPKFGLILQCMNHQPIFQTRTAQPSVTRSRPNS